MAAVVAKLSFDSLVPGDWSVICASLIHEREEMFGAADDYIFMGSTAKDVVKSETFRDKGWRINDVLLRLDHPAALERGKRVKA
jgi:hypothetical protein